MPTTVKQHDMKRPDNEENKGSTEGEEDDRLQGGEESPQNTGQMATLDGVTDVDKSMGPNPILFFNLTRHADHKQNGTPRGWGIFPCLARQFPRKWVLEGIGQTPIALCKPATHTQPPHATYLRINKVT
jgi:hypothetical protein